MKDYLIGDKIKYKHNSLGVVTCIVREDKGLKVDVILSDDVKFQGVKVTIFKSQIL